MWLDRPKGTGHVWLLGWKYTVDPMKSCPSEVQVHCCSHWTLGVCEATKVSQNSRNAADSAEKWSAMLVALCEAVHRTCKIQYVHWEHTNTVGLPCHNENSQQPGRFLSGSARQIVNVTYHSASAQVKPILDLVVCWTF